MYKFQSKSDLAILFVVVFAYMLLSPPQKGHAQTLTTLYSFTGGSDGGNPDCTLAIDKKGNLYGVTVGGGPVDAGTVFEVTPVGKEKVLYAAGGESGLLLVGNKLYGTSFGLTEGTVFDVTKKGLEKNLYIFSGPDGATPWGILVKGAKGNLYGTTFQGGAYNAGTVYEVTPSGAENVIYSFTGGADGGYLLAGVVRDSKGNLYGTTYQGGAFGAGTIFKVTPDGEEKWFFKASAGKPGHIQISLDWPETSLEISSARPTMAERGDMARFSK